jgi:hypothetical protein
MSNRARWKPLATLAIVLIVGVVGLWLAVSKMHERNECGSIDPVSGYQCRFTLSSDWKRDTQMPEIPRTEFFSPSPIPLRLWIDSHILHRPSPQSLTILLSDGSLKKVSGTTHLVAGYPEMIPASLASWDIIAHRHLMIDGFPATVITASTRSEHTTMLLVYVPDKSIAYLVAGYGSVSNSVQIDSEMQAIISSFHIEKVVQTGDKR